MDDMLKEFVVEAIDLAANVEEHLLTLERAPDDMDAINALFRSFHTIKGGAGFMNLPAMVSACHLTENLFDGLRTGQVAVTPTAIEASLQACSFVSDQLQKLANGDAPDSLPSMPSDLEAILKVAIEGGEIAGASAAPAPVVAVATATPAATTSNVISGTNDLDWEALYRAVVPAGMHLVSSNEHPQPVAATAAASPAAAPAQTWDGAERRKNPSTTASAKEDSIRIDAVKLDALLEVAGESVQAANQAAVLLEKLSQFKFDGQAATLMSALAETLARASRYSTELQRATLSTRMQPVGRLFQKFPRLVRELAKDLGKEVELVIEGAETEVDRVVVDSLYDPLVHMLRNSLDHGIEEAADRTTSGKPMKATVLLKAWQEGSSVMIQVADDGKGMDPDKLRAKAISKGLINEHQATTSEEAFQLIFLPGFSTKDVASSVSGRGVGMDVVKTAIEKHRGSIRIDSQLGQGTRFTIRLPIELSIVPNMLVRVSGEAALAMPMAVIERVVELPKEFEHVGGAPVLRDQGRPLAVRSLARILGYEPGPERVGVVIAAPQPYILAVDGVDGTADLVIKPLTALSVPGVNGTARNAEGELVLVVSLGFLLDNCNTESVRLAA
jgi:two-component system chemotaxis sensor kinase CheA